MNLGGVMFRSWDWQATVSGLSYARPALHPRRKMPSAKSSSTRCLAARQIESLVITG